MAIYVRDHNYNVMELAGSGKFFLKRVGTIGYREDDTNKLFPNSNILLTTLDITGLKPGAKAVLQYEANALRNNFRPGWQIDLSIGTSPTINRVSDVVGVFPFEESQYVKLSNIITIPASGTTLNIYIKASEIYTATYIVGAGSLMRQATSGSGYDTPIIVFDTGLLSLIAEDR